jgi:hypothetical protein
LLATVVGAALAQWGAGLAHADSAVGVDTVLGNALNMSGRSNVPRPLLEDGYDTVRHTPSGQLYGLPYDLTAPPNKTASGWEYKGFVELGVTGGNGNLKSTLFREYKDPRNGLLLNLFQFEADKPDTANFFTAKGGSLGQDDQFYGFSFGRYNDWKVTGFYNSAPHVFSSNFKSVFTNDGRFPSPGYQVLVPNTPTGINPVGATAAQALWDYSRTLPNDEVGLIRKKAGARLDINLSNEIKSYVSLTHEHRIGERPFGFQDNNTEGVEPIDYGTTDILAGIRYVDKTTAFNLYASASLFTNKVDVLNVRESNIALTGAVNPGGVAVPTTAGGATGIPYQRYVLSPDNEAYNLKAEFSHKIPTFWNAKINAALAYGSNRQDDPIVTGMPQNIPGYMSTDSVANAAANGIAFNINNWNGVNGVSTSRATSGMKLDSNLALLSLSLNPTSELSLKGTYRHYETKNKSGTYYAYNPLTGQWGYGFTEDGQGFNAQTIVAADGNGCQAPPGYTIPAAIQALCGTTAGLAQPVNPINFGVNAAIGLQTGGGGARTYWSPPRDNKTDQFTLAGTYDLGQSTSLEASYERENFSHTYRERAKTWEDKYKLGYVNRNIGNSTLRLSYEYDKKRGSFHDMMGVTRGLANWFAIYDIGYSRENLQKAIDITNLIAGGATAPQIAAAAAAAGAKFPTIAGAYPTATGWITGGGLFSPGNLYSGVWAKIDQADRNQTFINGRWNWMVRENIDFGVMAQIKRGRYPTNEIGLQKDDLNTLNFDGTWQSAGGTHLTAFIGRQTGKQKQVENYGNTLTSLAGNGTLAAIAYNGITGVSNYAPLAACGRLTSANIDCIINNGRDPLGNTEVNYNNTTNTVGLGFSQDYGKFLLGANYQYSRSVSKVSRNFGVAALTDAQRALESFTGQWPDMITDQQSLELNFLVPLTKQATVRFNYRLFDAKVKDWHYDYYDVGTGVNPVPGNYGSYDGGMNYRAQTVSVFLQYAL